MAGLSVSQGRSTQFTTAQSFGELSAFFRSAVADEESLQMGESMGVLASQIESIVVCLHEQPVSRRLTGMLMDLLSALRSHRAMVIELSPGWRTLHEYAAYLGSLNHFRVLISHWVTDQTGQGASVPNAGDFELLAWRLLGEGALLMDVHERTGDQLPQSEQEPPNASLVARARAWWGRLGN